MQEVTIEIITILLFSWALIGHEWLGKKEQPRWSHVAIAGPIAWVGLVVFFIDDFFD